MALRIVRSKFSPKQNQPAGRVRTTPREEALPVYVVDQNRLAAHYLLGILAKNRALHAVTLDDLVVQKPTERTTPVFIIDRGGIDLPLSECLRVLKERHPNAKFLVLDEEQPVAEIVRLLSLGIHGFMAYPQVAGHLLEAVQSLAQGKLWISSNVLEAYVQHSVAPLKAANESPTGQAITQRETQVIELVKRRLSNREIADILGIQESTVKFHLSNIFSKLRISRRSDLQDKGKLSEIWRKLVAS